MRSAELHFKFPGSSPAWGVPSSLLMTLSLSHMVSKLVCFTDLLYCPQKYPQNKHSYCTTDHMPKRQVDGTNKMAIDDEKEHEDDVSMVDATATATATATAGTTLGSERGEHYRDYSSLFDDDTTEAQRQSIVSKMEKAYEGAKSASEDWGETAKGEKISLITSQMHLIDSAFATSKWFVKKTGPFLDIREAIDVGDGGTATHSSSAQSAFSLTYEPHADDIAFLDHLEKQRKTFLKRKAESTAIRNAPFFAVIQSSGYGKSRLIRQIERQDYKVIYWTFASEQAYPTSNVAINEPHFKNHPRGFLEEALRREISVAVNKMSAGKEDPTTATMISRQATETKQATETGQATNTKLPARLKKPSGGKKIIFVVDEASELLKKFTSDGVSYYRALRTTFKVFAEEAEWLFFVVMATFSSITYLSPGLAMDPSNKPYSGHDDENQKPLNPFILGSSFRVNNNRATLLAMTVEDCHEPACLYSMGRPLWRALLHCEHPMTPFHLLQYARKKLINSNDIDATLTKKEEILAVLSVRLCLSISPTSLYVPSLVARHMGTALSVSDDRLSMVVTYPSEPVLAVGAKVFMKKKENTKLMISALQDFCAYGVVEKGYKGELIVRFLMTLAMDRAMDPETVKEVTLKDYLKKFNRKDADLGEVMNGLEGKCREQVDVDKELKMLRRLNLDWSDSRAILEAKKQDQLSGAAPRPLTYADGQVCFTHFVYLSKSTEGPLITHDLLRYAYRRSAAIVVEEGRRGIDKVIPLRIDNDKFVGLVVQDKNRVSDTLQNLTSVDNPETHHKVNVDYFLTRDEKDTFRSAGVDLEKHWPAILFAIGVDSVGADIAAQLEQKRFRHNSVSNTDRFDFPCIVLTGLDYLGLMDDDAAVCLKKLRDFEIVPSDQKQGDIPITYGS